MGQAKSVFFFGKSPVKSVFRGQMAKSPFFQVKMAKSQFLGQNNKILDFVSSNLQNYFPKPLNGKKIITKSLKVRLKLQNFPRKLLNISA